MRYIQDPEHKLQVATMLSEKLTWMQRDPTGLATQSNELNIRLQAMEQKAYPRGGKPVVILVSVSTMFSDNNKK
uniref:Uncharacterized protein n=1 Tax=Arundo donax TaxID=35708 RepID=A0A0A9E458_ARUDO